MTRRRHVAIAAGVLVGGLLLGGLAGCGGDDGAVDTSSVEPTTPSTTVAPPGSTAGATPSGTVAPDAAGVDLRVVFLEGGKVVTGHRRVAPTQSVARAALEQLIAGPDALERDTGFATKIPSDTRIGGIDIADGLATVELTPAVTDAAAQAQVVYTLTQFPSVQRVRFGTGGTPLTRDDFRDETPLVFLESVAPGDRISSPVRVAGESNTFEATVRIRILGADGSVLADTFTTATSGTGTWGTFSESVPFDKGSQTSGKVVVFWDSPKDGSPQDVTEVPVTFS